MSFFFGAYGAEGGAGLDRFDLAVKLPQVVPLPNARSIAEIDGANVEGGFGRAVEGPIGEHARLVSLMTVRVERERPAVLITKVA